MPVSPGRPHRTSSRGAGAHQARGVQWARESRAASARSIVLCGCPRSGCTVNLKEEFREPAPLPPQGVATAVLDGSPLQPSLPPWAPPSTPRPPSCVRGAGGAGGQACPLASPPHRLTQAAPWSSPSARTARASRSSPAKCPPCFSSTPPLARGRGAGEPTPPRCASAPRPTPHCPPCATAQLIGRIARQGQAAPACGYVYHLACALHRARCN